MLWQGILGMICYSFLLSIAGLFTNLQDDAMKVMDLPRARMCRAVVTMTLLISIIPFIYMAVHFKS